MPLLSTVVTSSPSGEGVAVELPRAVGQFWPAGTELSCVLHSAEAATLLRHRSLSPRFLSGTLTTFSLGELFAHVLSSVASGVLVVNDADGRRLVVFKDAQVVFASSSLAHERLGSLLVRLELLTSPSSLPSSNANFSIFRRSKRCECRT